MGQFEHDYPAIADLRARARRRIPHFAWEYLDSGTGAETALGRNRAALDAVLMTPRVMQGPVHPTLETCFLGRTYGAPFGIAPVGASGMMWPDAEGILARLAAERSVPYGLSTVATRKPEEIGPMAAPNGWFQLYPLGGDGVVEDVLSRAWKSGFTTLILTVDVPINSRRERQRRAGFNIPPKVTPRLIAQMLRCPAWLAGIARHGRPRYGLMEDYVPSGSVADIAKRMSPEVRPNPSWEDVARFRDAWPGPIVLKGVMSSLDAVHARDAGFDAVWVSNHGGRQLDAAPAAITALPAIRRAVGADLPLIYDSGVGSGLDIARALALGADFVMAGRAFHYGVGAFGAVGAARAFDILKEDLANVMWQVGARSIGDLRGLAEFTHAGSDCP